MAKMKKHAPRRKMTERDFLIEQCLMDAYYERTGEQIDESIASWLAGKKAQLSQGIKNIGTGIGNAAKSIVNKAIVGKRAIGTGISNLGKGISHNTKKGIRNIAAKGLNRIGAKNAAQEVRDYQDNINKNFSYDSVDTSDKFKKGAYGSVKDAKVKAELATLGKQISKLLTQYKEKGGEIPNTEIDTLIGYLSGSNNNNASSNNNTNNSISKSNKMNYSVDDIKSKPISQQSNTPKPLTPSGETAYKKVGSGNDIQTDDTKVTSSDEDTVTPKAEELAEKINIPNRAKDLYIKILLDLCDNATFEELNQLKPKKVKAYKEDIKGQNKSYARIALKAIKDLKQISDEEYNKCVSSLIDVEGTNLTKQKAFNDWIYA